MAKRHNDIYVAPDVSGGYSLSVSGKSWPCAVGRGGIAEKSGEGDGVTPIGSWPVRWLYYRPDREPRPKTDIETREITASMGWCDDPGEGAYNTAIELPFASSHEVLWREDHLYDFILVLGFNDDPVVPGRGSAIFLHIAREGYSATEGCVALSKAHFRELLALLTAESRVIISPNP